MTNYSKKYSKKAFLEKIGKVAGAVGREVLRPAFVLYYCMTDPETSAAAKSSIAAALGYFIFPLDVIPDMLPVVGYTDDVGLMMAAIAALGTSIKKRHKQQAAKQVKELFG